MIPAESRDALSAAAVLGDQPSPLCPRFPPSLLHTSTLHPAEVAVQDVVQLALTIQELVSDGMSYNVDPRFIVALAVAETQAGTNMNWGAYNAWNIRARSPSYDGPGKKPPYTSWSQSISMVNDLIAGSLYFGAGRTTTSTIYPTYEGPNYQVGLGNLNTALGQMHGNQNILTDPCNSLNPRSPNQ